MASNKLMSLKEAAAYADLSEMRLRNLLIEGRIVAQKQQLPGRDVEAWRIAPEAIDEYKRSGRKQSQNGKAWIIRLTPEQLAKLAPELKALGVELEERFHYDAEKAKEYRNKKKSNGNATIEVDDDLS